jgi:hypothetical protein
MASLVIEKILTKKEGIIVKEYGFNDCHIKYGESFFFMWIG